MKTDLNDLAYFAEVVSHGGFAAAGRALREPKSKLSRRIAGLEERLGLRLIERSSRRFRVTDIGRAFYERCKAIQLEAEQAEALVREVRSEPQGRIRFSCPTGMVELVSGLVAGFLAEHPKVRLQLLATNQPVDLIGERIDLALRVRIALASDAELTMRSGHGPDQIAVAENGESVSSLKPGWVTLTADGKTKVGIFVTGFFRLAPFALVFGISSAAAQDDMLQPFAPAAPLEGASSILREVMGFEMAHEPEGFVFGGIDLLRLMEFPKNYASGRTVPQVIVAPSGADPFWCSDMTCVEDAVKAGVSQVHTIERVDSNREWFLVDAPNERASEIRNEVDRHVAYALTGILHRSDTTAGAVADVEPGSPAHAVGLRAGARLVLMGETTASLRRTAALARRGDPLTISWRPDPKVNLEKSGTFAPRTSELDVQDGYIRLSGGASQAPGAPQDLPMAFRDATDPGLIALVLGRPDLATEGERRVAALRVLEGWSYNEVARACLEEPLARIDVQTVMGWTDTNLMGRVTGGFAASEIDPVFVEQPFLPFVQSMGRQLSNPEIPGAIHMAAGRLVQLEGCNSANFASLRREIAALAGVRLPAAPEPAVTAGFQPDWRGFLAECYPSFLTRRRAEGANPSDRGAVALCVCVEYGAAEYGDPDTYASFRINDWEAVAESVGTEINEIVFGAACSTSGTPIAPELIQRYEIFLRDNGL
ncbi:LysR family transcriptional regulator [Pikeienuella sp. HZG-20]|uniref:LysR family transcriptional regulator n=1 Tax=Paludibacillus litoralis TaxID=3133267 RepID=UPI0030EF9B0E